MKKLYKTQFSVPIMYDDGHRKIQPITIRCSEADYFFYTLLTNGVKRGILLESTARTAEISFFFKGYHWVDTEREVRD